MTKGGFSQRELQRFRQLGLDCITKKLSRGFNYYPHSVEQAIADAVAIPVKYGHRSTEFINALQTAVHSEFKGTVTSTMFPRTVVYQWLKTYLFPQPEESIRIYDVLHAKYIQSNEEYVAASDHLIAEGGESTILFLPPRTDLVSVVKFLTRKGNYFLTQEDGTLLPAPAGEKQPFALNPERISDEAYMTPMIITSYNPELEKELPSFGRIQKVYKMKGQEEINTYVDKTFDAFVRACRIRFAKPILRLGNKLFKDYINYEEDPQLR